MHRIGRGHSNRFTLAWTQRRRRTGNENVRPLAPRAQHCTSSARELRASRDKAGRRNCIPGYGVTSLSSATARKRNSFFLTGVADTGMGTPPERPHRARITASKIFCFKKREEAQGQNIRVGNDQTDAAPLYGLPAW